MCICDVFVICDASDLRVSSQKESERPRRQPMVCTGEMCGVELEILVYLVLGYA